MELDKSEGLEEKIRTSQKMPAWKLLVGLGVAYISAMFYGGFLHNQKLEQYTQRAFSRADANGNGFIEVEEALAAYKELGISNEEVLLKRVPQYPLFNFIAGRLKSPEQRKRTLDIITSVFDYSARRQPSYSMESDGDLSLHTFLQSSMFRRNTISETHKVLCTLADTNNDSTVSDDELEQAIRLAYVNRYTKGNEKVDELKLRIHPSISMARYFLLLRTYSPALIDNSELDRYANKK